LVVIKINPWVLLLNSFGLTNDTLELTKSGDVLTAINELLGLMLLQQDAI
jgi:hypothetical protein